MQSFLKAVVGKPGACATRYGCAGLVALAVLYIFFFPLPHGPFQATHGPTSALRAARAALLILLAMAACSGLPLFILASLFLLLFAASLLVQDVGCDPMPAQDSLGVACELRC